MRQIVTEGTANASLTTKQRIKSIFAASSGNLVEWYDFYIYAFAAGYFIHDFSGSTNPTVALIEAFAIFALGFLMRPIGSWIFGFVGDRIGRKKSMIYSIVLMAVSSIIIAIVPTKSVIGDWAMIILLIARLLQGISVGGEYGVAATYMSETATSGKRAFYSSFQYVTLIGGQFVAVLTVVILELIFRDETIRAWAWRLLFAFGGILALLSLLIRTGMHESGTKETFEHKSSGSLKAVFIDWRFLLICFIIAGAGSLGFYTYTIYTKTFLIDSVHMSETLSNRIMLIALFCLMLSQPLFGMLIDKIGRRVSLFIFTVASIVCTWPMYYLLQNIGGNIYGTFFILIWMYIILSFYASMAGVIKAELFPSHIRSLGTGLGHALGNVIFGGTASIIALEFKHIHMQSGFYVYFIIIFVILLITAFFFPKKTYLD
ncbi:MFS transporter [Helicobacter sp. 11S02629-2]|uniref:MFS transporter n=1 Tax=Helicobacter sp. 11S02629-2 TaxID=1476195 RepID=UPI000BA66D13|nr:MFS transporter [Helicobacter sp. 11S02629-2]PAF46033.1 alpha-ketoglutarate permease [Helicobacter sp. 11S02629-2]